MSLYNCEICNHFLLNTKIKDLYICNNCFHIYNKKENRQIIDSGYIYVLTKSGIWCDILHNLDKLSCFFYFLDTIYSGELKNDNIPIYIKVPILKGYLRIDKEYNHSHYFNINSMKLLCEKYNFNIIELYQLESIDEIFYIFQIESLDKISNNNHFNIYQYMLEELIVDIYDINNYI